MVEIVLRTTHLFGAKVSWSEPDRVIAWRYTPNKKFWYYKKENDHPITGRINRYGWKDKDWSLEKKENTFRIAVLGDSFVEALNIESERTFVAIAEQTLNNKNNNMKFELMNFARSGFTQTEELIVLKNDIIKFSPDMVVLFFLPSNDIEEVSPETADSTFRPFYYPDNNGRLSLDTLFNETLEFKIKSLINPLKQNSALISLFTERYNAYKSTKALEAKGKTRLRNKIYGYQSLATDTPEKVFLKSYELNKLLIKAMSDYCKERAIIFMLVIIDIETYFPEKEKEYKSIDLSFNTNFFEDDMGEHARLLKIEHVGLQRIFRGFYERTGVPLHWRGHSGHWNYQGHKLVADVLAEKIDDILKKKAQR